MNMTRAEFVALLEGPEMTDTDTIVILTTDGNPHEIATIKREGSIVTTLPSGVPEVAPQITIQLV